MSAGVPLRRPTHVQRFLEALHGSLEAMHRRFEQLRGSVLCFRNLTLYLILVLLEAGDFSPQSPPQL